MGFLAKDLDYLVSLVLLVLQMEHLKVDLVLQLVNLQVGLGENVGNLLLNLLSLSLLL